jgi:hypothetical protein
LETFWGDLSRKGVDYEKLLRQSLLAPATCNLLNPDKEKTVEKAFEILQELSRKIREKYHLSSEFACLPDRQGVQSPE